MTKIADQYLETHGRHLFGPGRKTAPADKSDVTKKLLAEGLTQIQCYRCGSRGHRAVNCQAQTAKRCFSCGKQATKHETADITVKSQLRRAMQVDLDLKDS